jgi:hypothetical protein
VFRVEAANTNFILYGLTWPEFLPLIYCTWGEHGNQYATDAVTCSFKIKDNMTMTVAKRTSMHYITKWQIHASSLKLYNWFDWFSVFNATFSNIIATSFSGGRSQSTRWEAPTMGKQLVNFITWGCESNVPFFVIYKARLKLYTISTNLWYLLN